VFLSLVYAAGSQCTSSAVSDEPRRRIKVIRRFYKYSTSHLQGEYLLIWRFIEQAVGRHLL
jgi:hypothetical protein